MDYDPYMSFEPILDSSKSALSFEDPSFLRLTYGDVRNKAYIDSLVSFSEGQDPFLENYVKCLVATLTGGSSSLVHAVESVVSDPGNLFNNSKALVEPVGIKNSIATGITLANVASTIKGTDRASDYEDAISLVSQQPAFLSECLKILEKMEDDGSVTAETMDKFLRDNCTLLDMLQKHQDYRFLKSEKTPSAMENKIGKKKKYKNKKKNKK
jgi:hypothetical protein